MELLAKRDRMVIHGNVRPGSKRRGAGRELRVLGVSEPTELGSGDDLRDIARSFASVQVHAVGSMRSLTSARDRELAKTKRRSLRICLRDTRNNGRLASVGRSVVPNRGRSTRCG